MGTRLEEHIGLYVHEARRYDKKLRTYSNNDNAIQSNLLSKYLV